MKFMSLGRTRSGMLMNSELKRLLHSSDVTLEKVLELPYITRVAKEADEMLVNFITPRVTEVLEYALADSTSKATTGAFKLLTCGEAAYMRNIIGEGAFSDRVKRILEKDIISPAVMGRLTTLTFNVVVENPSDAAYNECSFAFDLLGHAEMQSVFEMFSGMIKKGKKPQKWLKRNNFAEAIETQLRGLNFNHVPAGKNLYVDPVYNRACHLYNLVYQCCRTRVLRDTFRTGSMAKCLLCEFKDVPDFVKNEQWKAIVLMADATTVDSCMEFVPKAVSILSEMPDSLTCYRETAIHFLAKMMGFDHKVFDIVSKSSVPQTLISLVLQFPSSTIIQNAFVAFVKASIKNEDLACKLITYYLCVIIHFTSLENNRLIKYCFTQVMDQFIEAAKESKKISTALYEQQMAKKFITSVIKPYHKQLRKAYGGSIPPPIEEKSKE